MRAGARAFTVRPARGGRPRSRVGTLPAGMCAFPCSDAARGFLGRAAVWGSHVRGRIPTWQATEREATQHARVGVDVGGCMLLPATAWAAKPYKGVSFNWDWERCTRPARRVEGVDVRGWRYVDGDTSSAHGGIGA